jgi:hypothetical protein
LQLSLQKRLTGFVGVGLPQLPALQCDSCCHHQCWCPISFAADAAVAADTFTPQVGAELVITINTTRSSAPELQRMNVQLAYLRSYAGLGMALVK